ncbi:hypothetical protein DESUT3_15590 [Desulfuromonas versatilis]|uniref:Cytochrome c7-like domain-containing protein n=1 Tax=Desulfuromonas versatilis TaxID=2802975 RepID=A0ABN6DWI6_9BACT|nr:hypothetical protein [Desulfuromonas versatilis]BCR04490.1 hypothetical protein DESUT3_15590 [Desulfuromonas versatilis]
MRRRQKQQGEKGIHTRWWICIAALAVLALGSQYAAAFPNPGGTSQCVACHPIWAGGGGVGHSGHLGLGLSGSCNACHVVIGDTPDTTPCGQCHVVPGVALHHDNAQAASCVSCHPGTAPPENTAVPGYATITAALNPCDGSEERFASNTVSLDNDGDLLTDGADPDCQAPPEMEVDCNDGLDNDGDQMIDCADQDCAADPACQPPEQELLCADGLDNDGDNLVDCADPDCAADPACEQPGEICTDQMDNDGDGLTDCEDPDCANDAACQPPVMEICTDGVDNDGDGFIDCEDQDCAADPSCEQPVMEICTDGVDNDNDGFIDCKDPDCCQDPACKKQETCPQFNPPADHTRLEDEDDCQAFHAPGLEKPFTNGCSACHGSELTGSASGGFAPSCFTCHGMEWDETAPGGGTNVPADHTDDEDGALHKPGKDRPFSNGCTACHGQNLRGGIGPSCFQCHGREWDERVGKGKGHDDDSSDDHSSDDDSADDHGKRGKSKNAPRHDLWSWMKAWSKK